MFDNLKEKLGSFRKDAEAAAEETVEEVDETEQEDAADPATADTAEAVDAETSAESAGTAPDAEDAEDGGGPAATDAEAEHSTEPADARPDTDGRTEPASAERDPELADTDSDPGAGSDAGTGQSEATDTTPGTSSSADSEPDTTPGTSSSADSELVESDATAESGAPAQPAEQDAGERSEPDADGSDADDGEAARTTGIQRSSPMTGSRSSTDAELEPDGEEPAPSDESESESEPAPAEEEDDSTGFGRKAKSLVKGKFVIDEEDLEDPLHELEMALLAGDVEMGVAEEILDNIRDELAGETRTFTTSTGDVVEEALRDAIYDVISVGQFDFDERIAVEDKPLTIVFTGVNGVGKTTSIAKLSRYFEERGYSTVMANGDTYRAGANEQIQEHADALETKCISHQQGGDPAAVLYDAVEYAEANDVDIVLGDTAGRLHTDEGLMDQLEKIGRVVDPDMTLFVDEAVAGQDAVNRAREFDDAAEIDGAILTKADADSNGGAAISIAHVTGKPILFLGTGQGYDDLEQFDPEEMADRLLAEE